MGSGIGQVSAQGKYNVIITDKNEASLHNSKIVISKSIDKVAKKKFVDNLRDREIFKNEVLDRIKFTTNLKYALCGTDMVIEAITEDINDKQNLFKIIEENTKSDTILTTNTSSLSIAKISENLKNKQNFCGLHFFNPVPIMKLLEVIVTNKTSNEVLEALINYGNRIGKVPVKCKDTPGFIVNRLLYPYLFDAFRLYENNVARKEDIDKAMKLGASHSMGPFELSDFIGLDIIDKIMEQYPEKHSKVLKELVRNNQYGIKSGEGFYKY
uniref:3-hydroxyacyl-CoA dehydrogenase n=1 Tax=Strongyloides venezuelensis TaxID=75913 RepID=A0A0K0F0R6_STRVS